MSPLSWLASVAAREEEFQNTPQYHQHHQGCKSLRLTLISDFSAASGFSSCLHIKSFLFLVNKDLLIKKKIIIHCRQIQRTTQLLTSISPLYTSCLLLLFSTSCLFIFFFSTLCCKYFHTKSRFKCGHKSLCIYPQVISVCLCFYKRLLMELTDLDVAMDLWLFVMLLVITTRILICYRNKKHILDILSIFDCHAALTPDIICCSKPSALILDFCF